MVNFSPLFGYVKRTYQENIKYKSKIEKGKQYLFENIRNTWLFIKINGKYTYVRTFVTKCIAMIMEHYSTTGRTTEISFSVCHVVTKALHSLYSIIWGRKVRKEHKQSILVHTNYEKFWHRLWTWFTLGTQLTLHRHRLKTNLRRPTLLTASPPSLSVTRNLNWNFVCAQNDPCL